MLSFLYTISRPTCFSVIDNYYLHYYPELLTLVIIATFDANCKPIHTALTTLIACPCMPNNPVKVDFVNQFLWEIPTGLI